MGEDLNGPANVVLHQLKFPPYIFGEFADVQVAVHKKNADHRRREEIGQVVGHHGQLVQFQLVLRVDGIQLFVYRLQLLCGALQLFIGGEKLFVGGLEFAVYRFQPLNGGAQIALRNLEFPFQFGDAAGCCGIQVVFFHNASLLCGPVLQEQYGRELAFFTGSGGDGLYRQIDHFPARRTIHRNVGIGDGSVFRPAAAQGGGRHQVQILVEHAEKVQRSPAGRQGKIVGVIPKKVKHRIFGIQHGRGGQEVFQECGIEPFGHRVFLVACASADAGGRDGLDIGDVEGGGR